MTILSITRDAGSNPSIVRITTTDNLATITTAGYLLTQADSIKAINYGPFEWVDGDLVSIDYDGGQGIFNYSPSTNSFVAPPDAEGANEQLSNLNATAVNQSIIPGVDNTVDLGSETIRWRHTYTGTIRTGTTAGNTVLFQARDVDGLSWTTFATMTAGNDPTFSFSGGVTGATKATGTNDTTLSTTAFVQQEITANAYTLPFIFNVATGSTGDAMVFDERSGFGGHTITWGVGQQNYLSSYNYWMPGAFRAGFLMVQGTDPTYQQTIQGVATTTGGVSGSETDVMTFSTIFSLPLGGILTGNLVQAALSVGSIHSPKAFAAVSGSKTNRYVYNLGTGGVGAASGFALTNDTVYMFPILLPRGNYNQIIFEIETADASGTGDIEYTVFYPYYNADNDGFFAQKVFFQGTLSNISTTGVKANNITSVLMSGWYWIALRADNIGTALNLGTSTVTYEDQVQNIFGGDSASSSRNVAYGYFVSGQTSMPVQGLNTITPSGVITAPVGLALRCA